MSIERFEVNPEWKSAAIFTAHPDDAEGLLTASLCSLLAAGIPTTIVTATMGELGKDKGQYREPEKMRAIRARELRDASRVTGVRRKSLGLPDLGLEGMNYNDVLIPVLFAIRALRPSVIFTLNPEIKTPFYHPDHYRIGKVVADAATGMNTIGYYPSVGTATEQRSALYLWTTHAYEATHSSVLTPELQNLRNTYLYTVYPSQFVESELEKWKRYFDTINKVDESGNGIEYLIQIR